MLSMLQGQFRQLIMRLWCGSDNDDIDSVILDHVFGSPIGLDAGVILLGIVVGLWCTLDNSVQFQMGDIGNKRNVECFGAEAISDHTNIKSLGSHLDLYFYRGQSQGFHNNRTLRE